MYETDLQNCEQILSVRQLCGKECGRISPVSSMPAVYSAALAVRGVKASVNAFRTHLE